MPIILDISNENQERGHILFGNKTECLDINEEQFKSFNNKENKELKQLLDNYRNSINHINKEVIDDKGIDKPLRDSLQVALCVYDQITKAIQYILNSRENGSEPSFEGFETILAKEKTVVFDSLGHFKAIHSDKK